MKMENEKGYMQFFDSVEAILKKVRETQGPNIEKAAKIVSDAVINNGVIHVFGAGHSNLLAEEIFFRAGTLVPVNHVVDVSISGTVNVVRSSYLERLEGSGSVIFDSIRPAPQDAFIVISNSGRNAAPVEIARDAKAAGHKVIALTSITYSKAQPSRHPSGCLLLDFADVVVDNCGTVGDVSVFIPGMKQGLGPTSTIAGGYALHAIMVQAVFNIRAAQVEPPVFLSGNFDEGMDFNEDFLCRYWSRIRNW
jgi:uncharacterized phosphosugar-binding protein